MTAIMVLRQRDAVHMMTDTAAYDGSTGVLASIDLAKCVPMPSLQAAVACTGPAMLGHYFGCRLPEVFDSFDGLIEGSKEHIPELFEQYADEMRGGDAFSTLYLIGWHASSSRPAAYAMDMWTAKSS